VCEVSINGEVMHDFFSSQLSARNNRLLRMFQVSKLSHLKILDLAGNYIVTMEGLKELKLLTWLSLSNNSIGNMDCLRQNVHLEHLDISENAVAALGDLSYLKNLKVSSPFNYGKVLSCWQAWASYFMELVGPERSHVGKHLFIYAMSLLC